MEEVVIWPCQFQLLLFCALTSFPCDLNFKNFHSQSADRQGDGQIDFEGLRQIYNDIMNVKEVQCKK